MNQTDQELIKQWNQTESEYPKHKTIIDLFEKQVQQTPESIAVIFEDQSISYRELNQRVNQLANYLLNRPIELETLVGIYIDRSLEMLIGMLAILKAGGAYVPLDPEYPADRLQFMLDDAQIGAILSKQALADSLIYFKGDIYLLDLIKEELEQQPLQVQSSRWQADKLAYVIYTSGSTGKPKGVLIEHSSLTNFLLSMQKELSITEDDHLLAITRITFDIAVLELFLPLISGASIRLANFAESRQSIRLESRLANAPLTLIQTTPSTWQMLMTSDWRPNKNTRLLSGGEALNPELAERLLATGGPLWNMYGPTETTIWSTLSKINSSQDITIGKPIANTQIYILNQQNEAVGIGATGELCIAGDGLARGYLNRPELTSDRFISVPAAKLGIPDKHDIALYRTGDLAHWRSDGNLICQGRIDHQVKLRGFRIELGEIEAQLEQYDEVTQSAVLVREDTPGIKHLVAYLQTSQQLDIQQLRKKLSVHLPDYMVPNIYVAMDDMPMTFSGKLDRKALPKPDTNNQLSSFDSNATPRNEMETNLVDIWQEVLGLVSSPGINDDFFDLGGDSLLAVRLVYIIETKLQLQFPLDSFSRFRTIAQLADILKKSGSIDQNKDKQHFSAVLGESLYRKLLTFHVGRKQQRLSPDSLLMKLNENAKGPLLYFCGAFRLAPGMAEYPIIGMDTGHGAMAYTDKNIRNLATHYVQEIIQHNLPGPYYLIGYSLGSQVAFEMAKGLLAMGKEVPLLCMLDQPVDLPYPGKVAQFICSDGEFKHLLGAKDWQNKIQELFPAGVTIDPVPGNHDTIMNQGALANLLGERIKARLKSIDKQQPLPKEALKLSWQAAPQINCKVEQKQNLIISLENNSNIDWDSPLSLGYHWYDKHHRLYLWSAGLTPLSVPVKSGQTIKIECSVIAPEFPDQYCLVFDLLEHNATWASLRGIDTCTIPAQVLLDEQISIDYKIELKAAKKAWKTITDKETIYHTQRLLVANSNPSVEVYQELCNAMRRWGRLETALEFNRQGLSQYPHDPDLHVHCAKLAMELNQIELALKHARYRTELPQVRPTNWAFLGHIYATKGDDKLAIEAYSQALNQQMDSIWREELAECLERTKQPEAAAEQYKQVMQQRPDRFLWLKVARLLRQAKKFNQAIEACRNAIEQNPKHIQSYCLALDIARSNNQSRQGLDMLSEFPADLRPSSDLQRAKGDCWYELKQYESAQIAFQKGIDIDPSGIWNWLKLANTLTKMDKYEKAQEVLLDALEIHSKHPEILLKLGDLAIKEDHAEKALNYFSQVVLAKPKFLPGLIRQGKALYKLQRWQEALNSFQQALKIKPENVYALVELGDVYRALDLPEDAILQYNKALELGYPYPKGITKKIERLTANGS